MKTEIKRHLISFTVTFFAMFLVFVYPAIFAGEWTVGVLVAACLAAIRSAFKIAWEMAIIPLLTKLIEFSKKLIA